MSGFFIDQHDDTFVMATTIDKRVLDAQADACKALRNSGAGNGKDEKLCMSADTWVVNDWCVKRGVTFATFMRDKALQERFIQDPDNAAFRVWEGRL